MWVVLAFIFSNLFSFIIGYIVISVFIKFVEGLPDTKTGESKNEQ